MKVEIYEPLLKTKEDKLFLRLHQTNDYEVALCACSENGNTIFNGTLLYITEKGIRLAANVSERVGLPLDPKDRSVIVYFPSDPVSP
jgi:hypothetical protein